MYKAYWGFREKPFENAPDPKFMYYSSQHLEALTRLLYAVVEKKSAAILTGEYGSGKTLVSRVIANKLIQEDKYDLALIVNPAISAMEMLREILYQLGDEPEKMSQKIDLLRILNDKLYKNMNEERHTVIIIDEAQTIENKQVFEEIRLLLNFQSDDRFLLTILLLGQPQLKQKVGQIPQLEQRLSIKYHLSHLNQEETISYIDHRCRVGGLRKKIFTDAAYKAVFEASRGVPRKINNICDMALLVGYNGKLKELDEEAIKAVADELKEYVSVA